MKNMNFKVGSLFTGVGGIDLGFQNTGHFNVIYANELDSYPVATYKANIDLFTTDQQSCFLDNKNITCVSGNYIPDFDILVGGFPCQPFSIAGKREGFNDERGNLFFEIIRIIKEKAAGGQQPEVVFFENVKNLVSHDNGNTFRAITELLSECGYFYKYKVMNTSEYGNIPQNRERIYIVGFLDETYAEKFKFPEPIPLTTTIHDFIDFDTKMDDKYYYTNSCPFYSLLEAAVTSDDTVYQWRRKYVRENKRCLCPTLTANMGTGGHNVPLIKGKHGIRKLTPRECFNLQGFPKDFILPDISDGRLYKQAGNSVTVSVIERIAEQIFEAVQ